ncbi:MAG: hypothetical protein KF849_05100 [Rhizobiaceae bacterium]|nr:hypothetical protein [Rhizobiaceae bacterium]
MLAIRSLFLILIVAGAGLGIAYPWLNARYGGYEIGTWRVFESGGFTVAEARPALSEAPVIVSVDMVTRGPLRADRQGAVLTVTARSGGRTVLAQALDFDGVNARILNPQTGDAAYRTRVGSIASFAEDGLQIDVARGDDERANIVTVDVIVEASPSPIQPNAIPVGYVLLGIGFVGFIASFRARAPKNPNSSPPPQKWGRQ